MSDLAHLTKLVRDFRDARDWKQFHNPKDAALSLTLEATEVLEHFQWKNGEVIDAYAREHKKEIGDELADVLHWVLLMANDLEIDLVQAFEAKMVENEAKYPVEKARGRAVKYHAL